MRRHEKMANSQGYGDAAAAAAVIGRAKQNAVIALQASTKKQPPKGVASWPRPLRLLACLGGPMGTRGSGIRGVGR